MKLANIFKDYLHVYSKPADNDVTESQKLVRQIREDNPKAFMDTLNRMEARAREMQAAQRERARKSEAKDERKISDDGAETCMQAGYRLIAEFKKRSEDGEKK